MNTTKSRTYGQIRADKELLRKEEQLGRSPRPLAEQLSNRICFRASTQQRELSDRVQKELDLTQGELFRSLLLAKADELGLTATELTPGELVS